MALIPFIPLLGIATIYLCNAGIPLRKRVIASMPSILLALMIPSAFIVGFVTDSHTEIGGALRSVVAMLLPLAALCFTLYTLFKIRTWMNLLQALNLFFGLLAFYFMVMGPLA